jgi:hypothetical protein
MTPSQPPPRSLLLLLALAAGCGGQRPGTAPADSAPLLSTTAPAAGSAPASAASATPAASAASHPGALADAYRGTIEPDLPVAMRLRREGEVLKGTYFYENKGIDLVLSGTVASDGSLEVAETAGNKKTGIFTGRIAPDGAISGSWTDAAGDKPRPFHLAPIARSGEKPPWIAKKWIRSRRKTSNDAASPGACKLDLSYPEVFGLADKAVEARVDDMLKRVRRAQGGTSLDEECQSPLTISGDYTVYLNRGDVLSVGLSYGVTECGTCAYPGTGGALANVVLSTGAELPLGKVLRPGAIGKVRAMLEKAVRPRVLAMGPDSKEYLPQLLDAYLAGDFALTDEGVRFIAVYQLPHAIQAMDSDAGVTLSYGDLSAALNPKSPAARVWEKP